MARKTDSDNALIEPAKLDRLLADLFFKFQRANWIRGGNLGRARQSALDLIRSFLDTLDPVHPVTQYLKSAAAKQRNRWAQSIMQSPKSEKNHPLQIHERLASKPKIDADAMAVVGKIKRVIADYDKKRGNLIQTSVNVDSAFQGKAKMDDKFVRYAPGLKLSVQKQDKIRQMILAYAQQLKNGRVAS